MLTRFRNHQYSARAVLLALFVLFAMVLGGGGSANPVTETLLQAVFAVFVIAWIWLPAASLPDGEATGPDHAVLWLITFPLLLPFMQLIPLPPDMWTGLPGRADAVAALGLVGEGDGWRPLSLSPSRTLSAFLAIIPAMFCLYAMSRLTVAERRLVLIAVFAMVLVNGLMGLVQLAATGGRGLNLYENFSKGWVTGFQSNRNHAADVFSIGILACAVLAAPYFGNSRLRIPGSFDRRAFTFIVAGLILFCFVALVMTGSRAGIILGFVALLGAGLILVPDLSDAKASRTISLVTVIGVPIVLLGLAVVAAQSRLTEIGRVFARFTDLQGNRIQLWQDTWFALKQVWPAGVGMGGYEPAAFSAERLEVMSDGYPNRAHNELLELGLEAGVAGYLVLAAVLVLVLWLTWRTWTTAPPLRRHVVFGLAVIVIVMLHSLVDYPLRTMALACLTGIAGGMLAIPPVSRTTDESARLSAHAKGLG